MNNPVVNVIPFIVDTDQPYEICKDSDGNDVIIVKHRYEKLFELSDGGIFSPYIGRIQDILLITLINFVYHKKEKKITDYGIRMILDYPDEKEVAIKIMKYDEEVLNKADYDHILVEIVMAQHKFQSGIGNMAYWGQLDKSICPFQFGDEDEIKKRIVRILKLLEKDYYTMGLSALTKWTNVLTICNVDPI